MQFASQPALSGGTDWWRMEWPFFQSPKNIFQRPKFAGKSLKFCRKSDFCQINFKLRNFEISEPEKMHFHTPSRSIPPLDSLLASEKQTVKSSRGLISSV